MKGLKIEGRRELKGKGERKEEWWRETKEKTKNKVRARN